MKIKAIIWDYDGTLVDTRRKNLNVTKAVISEVLGDVYKNFPALLSLENYELASNKSLNWQKLYSYEFGLNDEQINYAGSLWTKYQLLDKTRVELFDGIGVTISGLKKYQQGIVSQNSYENIKKSLEQLNLLKYLSVIIGYEEIGLSKQKPDPEGLLTCINKLADLKEEEFVIYVGDHQTDIQCAYNANNRLNRKAVISICLPHKKSDLANGWEYKPDYIAYEPSDIIKIIDSLVSR